MNPTAPAFTSHRIWDFSSQIVRDLAVEGGNCQVVDRALLIGQRENHAARRTGSRHLFVRHKLIHGIGLPEVTVRKVLVGHRLARGLCAGQGRRKVLVELHEDLIPIIREPRLVFNQPAAVADVLADPAVLRVVKVVDDFSGPGCVVRRIARILDRLAQPAAGVPLVHRNVRVAVRNP